MNFFRKISVATLVIFLAASAMASDPNERATLAAIDVLIDSALDAAENAEPIGFEFAQMLLRLPEPWNRMVIDKLESPGGIDKLKRTRNTLNSRTRKKLDGLLATLSEIQGVPPIDSISLLEPAQETWKMDWNASAAHWLRIDKQGFRGALQFQSVDCTPDLVAFSASDNTPLARSAAQARFSNRLYALSLDTPVILRAQRGDCLGEQTQLSLTLLPGSDSSGDDGSDNPALVTRSIAVDQFEVVPLSQRMSARLSLVTTPGWIYEVHAAPLSGDVDPLLVRADPKDLARAAVRDDDGGWGLGAKIEHIVGSAQPEQLAVLRVTPDRGHVAVLVTREPIPSITIDVPETVLLERKQSTWRRLVLPPGSWTIETRIESGSLDPFLIVKDELAGEVLAENDDATPENLAASVSIDVSEPTPIVVQLGNLNEAGSCEIIVTRSDPIRAASTRTFAWSRNGNQ